MDWRAHDLKKRMGRNNTPEEWIQLRDDMENFVEYSDASERVKRQFAPLGYLETVYMICAGIEKREDGYHWK